jgi:type I restriction enzyme S subunit
MTNWREYKLSEIAELRSEKFTPNKVISYPYIGLEHIEPKSLRINGIGSSNDISSLKSFFYPQDVLYGKLRPYFQKVYSPDFKGVCSTDIFVIKAKKGVNSKYLFYLLATDEFTALANLGSTGTRMPRADWKHLSSTFWNIPDLSTQTAIAEILSSLDDKIELNNKINQELETLAQTLFKQWFIDFEFPNENGEPYKSSGGEIVDSELGQIPRGWKILKFKDIVEKYIDNRGKTPPTVKEGIPLVEVKHMPDIGIFPSLETDKFLSQDVYDSFLRAYLEEGDILMSTVGTIGRLNIVPNFQTFAIAQNVLGIRFNKTIVTQLFMFCLMRTKGFNDEINSRLIETVQSSIKRGDLEKVPVLVPTLALIKDFDELVRDLFNEIKSMSLEKLELINLRDSLLPKLISGELKINEISN